MGLLLCSIEFITRIYCNRRLAAADLFHKFTQSISSRSSHLEVFCRKSILTNSAKFTGKHLFQSLLFNKVAALGPATLLKKRLWHRYFPTNFAKFLRTPFFTKHLRWLPLKFYCTILMNLSWRTEFCQQLLYYFENFVSVYKPLTKSWFDIPTTQISIFTLFVNAEVLFEGAFSLWVPIRLFRILFEILY